MTDDIIMIKCPCGDRGCNQYTLSIQGSVGFDAESAQRLVTAWNTHDELVEALEAMLLHHHGPRGSRRYGYNAAVRAEAALARAKGVPSK